MLIRPLTREDLMSVATITFETSRNDELIRWLCPRVDIYPDDLRRYQLIRLRTRLVDVGSHGFVAVSEEGDPYWNGAPEIVGYAFYVRKGNDKKAARWQPDSMVKKIERYLLSWEQWYYSKVLDRASDPKRSNEYDRLSEYDLYSKIDTRWHLALLAVSATHQRRGIGRTFVEHCQKLAADDDVPVTLEASVAGRGLYTKLGFKIVEQVKILDGLDGIAMLWEPDHLKGKWMEDMGEGNAKLTVQE